MYLEYTPEGQPTQRWAYQPGRIHSGEMILLEKHTGLKYGQEFKQALLQGGTVARRGLLWLFQHRDHPALKFEDVAFYDDELVLVQDKDELAAEIGALEDFTGIPADQRETGLALLRSQMAGAPDAPGKGPASTAADETSTAPADASTDQAPTDPSGN